MCTVLSFLCISVKKPAICHDLSHMACEKQVERKLSKTHRRRRKTHCFNGQDKGPHSWPSSPQQSLSEQVVKPFLIKNLSRKWRLNARSYPPAWCMLERGAANSSSGYIRHGRELLQDCCLWHVECSQSALFAMIVFSPPSGSFISMSRLCDSQARYDSFQSGCWSTSRVNICWSAY